MKTYTVNYLFKNILKSASYKSEMAGQTDYFEKEIFITVEPPLMAISPQWPPLYKSHCLIFVSMDSPYIDSCLNLSYNSNLFIMATFFCPQGGHCGEVQDSVVLSPYFN